MGRNAKINASTALKSRIQRNLEKVNNLIPASLQAHFNSLQPPLGMRAETASKRSQEQNLHVTFFHSEQFISP